MTTVHDPLVFEQGDTWQIAGTLKYADGTPFDLNSPAVVRWRLEDVLGNVVLDYSLADRIAITDIAAGAILITVLPAITANILPGYYVDQLRATDPTGFVSTQWQGRVDVKATLFS